MQRGQAQTMPLICSPIFKSSTSFYTDGLSLASDCIFPVSRMRQATLQAGFKTKALLQPRAAAIATSWLLTCASLAVISASACPVQKISYEPLGVGFKRSPVAEWMRRLGIRLVRSVASSSSVLSMLSPQRFLRYPVRWTWRLQQQLQLHPRFGRQLQLPHEARRKT